MTKTAQSDPLLLFILSREESTFLLILWLRILLPQMLLRMIPLGDVIHGCHWLLPHTHSPIVLVTFERCPTRLAILVDLLLR